MQVVAVHPDVIVATSRIYQTTCTLVRRGDEAFLIDSPILPDELELLPTVAAQSDFKVVGLLATHGDWDHLLGRLAFASRSGSPSRRRRCSTPTPAAPERELRAFDDEHYVVRPAPLELGTPQSLPVPGRCGLGPGELDLHPLGGHTPDGMAIWVPWARVLVVGDHLSPVEIPMLGDAPGSLRGLPGDARPAGAARRARRHRRPGPRRAAGRRARAGDPARGPRLPAGARRPTAAGAELPLARRTDEQRKIHQRNVATPQGCQAPLRVRGP